LLLEATQRLKGGRSCLGFIPSILEIAFGSPTEELAKAREAYRPEKLTDPIDNPD
jgi:hypothetical protein